jgi:hypothetical protein
MVSLVNIPTTETFNPCEKSWHEVMKFIVQCENVGQSLRISQWPNSLRSAIDFQYRYTFEIYERHDGSTDQDWQRMDATELRSVLDRMRDATQGQSSSATNLVESFRTWLATNKLSIDWGSEEDPLSHPFAKDVNEILTRYHNVLVQLKVDELDASEESLLVKLLKKEIIHKNLSTEGRAQIKTTIEGELNGSSSSLLP